jgi:hypothetical protein
MCGAALEDPRYVDSSRNGEIRAGAIPAVPETQNRSTRYQERPAVEDGSAVHGQVKLGSRRRNDAVVAEPELGPGHGDFQRRRGLVVTDEDVGQPVRERVHGSSHGDSERLESPAPEVLHRRQQPRPHDV